MLSLGACAITLGFCRALPLEAGWCGAANFVSRHHLRAKVLHQCLSGRGLADLSERLGLVSLRVYSIAHAFGLSWQQLAELRVSVLLVCTITVGCMKSACFGLTS